MNIRVASVAVIALLLTQVWAQERVRWTKTIFMPTAS